MLYAIISQSVGKPDPFRQHYRDELRTLITDIVRDQLTQEPAAKRIAAYANRLPETDRSKFIELAQLQLLGLHEGNFARHKIRPSEFAAWKKIWQGTPA